jgi:hypothetical protein
VIVVLSALGASHAASVDARPRGDAATASAAQRAVGMSDTTQRTLPHRRASCRVPPVDLPAPTVRSVPRGSALRVGAPWSMTDGSGRRCTPRPGSTVRPACCRVVWRPVSPSTSRARRTASVRPCTPSARGSEAPTLLGEPFAARVRPGAATGWYDVETWQHGRRLVRATVELTGADPLDALADLVALADGATSVARPGPALPDVLRVRHGCDASARAAHPSGVRRVGPALGAVGPRRAARRSGSDRRRRDAGRRRRARLPVGLGDGRPGAQAGLRAVLLGSMRLQVAGRRGDGPGARHGTDGRRRRAQAAGAQRGRRHRRPPLAVFDALHLAVGRCPTSTSRSTPAAG